MEIKGITVGDIHLGAEHSQRIYNELNEIFLNDLRENDYHYCILTGDLFDKKLSVNEYVTVLVVSFINDLMKIAADKHIKVRVIRGTKTHDLDQLNILSHYAGDPKYDFKIISTVQTEELFPDFHVLYIPEEYVENQFEYYKDYKTPNKYDMIFGHGTWSFQAFVDQKEKSDAAKILSAPILVEEEWLKTLKPGGKVIFGHIHERSVDKSGRIYYPGSFSAWEFGNRSLKGYAHVHTNNGRSEVSLINNMMCPQFFVCNIDAKEKSFDDIHSIIDAEINNPDDWYLFKIVDLNHDVQNLLRKAYSGRHVKFDFKMTQSLMSAIEADQKEFTDKYAYILKEKTSVEAMVKRFLHEERGIDLDIDFITKALSEVQK